MLLRFKVSNHRSILHPAELSLVAVDDDRQAARAIEGMNEKILTVAGIYGANASGKSNVVDAIAWLVSAIAHSLRQWTDYIPRSPFKFDPGPGSVTTFELDMVIENTRYAYQLEVDDKSVRFEGLYSFPLRARRILFEREGMEITFRRGLGHLAGTKELLTPTTLALSAAMRFDDPEITRFGRRIAGIAVSIGHGRGVWRRARIDYGLSSYTTAQMFMNASDPLQSGLSEHPDPQGRELALTLLRFADLGIADVQIVEELVRETADTSPARRRRTQLVHRSKRQEVAFDLADESDGTRTWYGLIGPVLGALRMGQLLLFDELDASLHPRLTARLIELFQDPATNPRSAQLIFTSHDTSLLNFLNRDEVWLTEKTSDGDTRLTALAEFGGDKVRRSLNLERAYLQGRFGAVPELDQHVLRNALGLMIDDR